MKKTNEFNAVYCSRNICCLLTMLLQTKYNIEMLCKTACNKTTRSKTFSASIQLVCRFFPFGPTHAKKNHARKTMQQRWRATISVKRVNNTNPEKKRKRKTKYNKKVCNWSIKVNALIFMVCRLFNFSICLVSRFQSTQIYRLLYKKVLSHAANRKNITFKQNPSDKMIPNHDRKLRTHNITNKYIQVNSKAHIRNGTFNTTAEAAAAIQQ